MALWLFALCFGSTLCWSPIAAAEGTAQLGSTQRPKTEMTFMVDVLTAGEVLNIAAGDSEALGDATLVITVTVTDPDGGQQSFALCRELLPPLLGCTTLGIGLGQNRPGFLGNASLPGTVNNPLRITTTKAGVYKVTFASTRTDSIGPFDITVTPNTQTAVVPASPPGGRGRLFSQRWLIDVGTFAMGGATDTDLYLLVPLFGDRDVTVRARFTGFNGNDFSIVANGVGLPDTFAGTSQPFSALGGDPPTTVPELGLSMYLTYPGIAKGGSLANVTATAVKGSVGECTVAFPGEDATFRFDVDVEAPYVFIVDTNKDGVYSLTEDRVFRGSTAVGTNTIVWDGKDVGGAALAVGEVHARLFLLDGPTHLVLGDTETVKPGLRLFAVDDAGSIDTPRPLAMRWDDTALTNDTSGNVHPGPITTPVGGVDSGSLADAPICGGDTPNAHCWGNFVQGGPGDLAFVDTWTAASEVRVDFTLQIVDPDADPDVDQLTNREECVAGTKLDDPDTDKGGVKDGVEVKQDKTDPLNGGDDLHCGDGILNGNETSVDCGGKCPGCDDGLPCVLPGDCKSGNCKDKICVSECGDGILNGSETDQDCGGVCSGCDDGKGCKVNGDCKSGICLDKTCISCSDKKQNGTESDIDCGGLCKTCEDGKKCNSGADCFSGKCSSGLCVSCTDKKRNGDESDIDCGGSCTVKCDNGKLCSVGSDCKSGLCDGTTCQQTLCSDSTQNGDETDIDCGGSCSTKCDDGKGCKVGADCTSGSCADGTCISCSDGKKNGNEGDTDCGGSCSVKCDDTQSCHVPADCKSGRCEDGVCASCTDKKKSGDEGDIDCGGSCPKRCGNDQSCKDGTDCTSGICQDSTCKEGSCSDGFKTGDESDVDCGGTCPVRCDDGKDCNSGADCKSGRCEEKICTSCGDGTQNGDETDVDCGGSCDTKCGNNKHCEVNSDCKSGICEEKVCVFSACTNEVQNGDETDIDCGGSCTMKCEPGQGCKVDTDCTSEICVDGRCALPTCSDGKQNGDESGVDCGGTCPNACSVTNPDGENPDGDAIEPDGVESDGLEPDSDLGQTQDDGMLPDASELDGQSSDVVGDDGVGTDGSKGDTTTSADGIGSTDAAADGTGNGKARLGGGALGGCSVSSRDGRDPSSMFWLLVLISLVLTLYRRGQLSDRWTSAPASSARPPASRSPRASSR
ncbi:MAG: hypothetical protein KC609_24800 [Myxococcales bacterium]|nr:hypothetical protein [Myxococcales bacterium]